MVKYLKKLPEDYNLCAKILKILKVSFSKNLTKKNLQKLKKTNKAYLQDIKKYMFKNHNFDFLGYFLVNIFFLWQPNKIP